MTKYFWECAECGANAEGPLDIISDLSRIHYDINKHRKFKVIFED